MADESAGLAVASACGLADAAQTVYLEETDGAHVAAGLADALGPGVDRVAFQRGRPIAQACPTAPLSSWSMSPRRRNPGRTTKQTTDHGPSSLDVRDRPELTRARSPRRARPMATGPVVVTDPSTLICTAHACVRLWPDSRRDRCPCRSAWRRM